MTTRKLRSILFVDDEQEVCVAAQSALCLLAGLDVTTACSGKLGIDLAYELRPDLIVLDVMMPGLDGLATYQSIRESSLIANTPVIFMTPTQQPSEVGDLLALGAIGVLSKPIDPLRMPNELAAMWAEMFASNPRTLATADTLAEQFLKRTRVDVDRIRSLEMTVCRDLNASLLEIGQIAHSIHGTGAMVGYSAVSESGGALQRHVESLLYAGKVPRNLVGPVELVRLHELTDALARALVAAHATTPSQTAMFQ